MEFGIKLIMILIALSLSIIIITMTESFGVKLKNKVNLIPSVCLTLALGALLYYWFFVFNSPLQEVVRASHDYYACLNVQKNQDTQEGSCSKSKNKMMAKVAAAEMLGLDKKVIYKAVERGMYEANSE